MKKFFTKLKNWWSNHKPSKRRLIQLYAFLLYNANIKGFIKGEIYQGNTKYFCVPGLNCYSCPGAVGACPLGALQNALASSGTRAPFYVIGIILLFGLILGRTICGFLCPVGLGQELLYKIKSPKLRKSRFTRIFSWFKYVLLAVLVIAIPLIYSLQNLPVPAFCKYICPAGTLGGAIALLANPSNADLFGMLGPLFTWKFCVLVAICVASVFIFRFFCRFICPLGALYGFFNKISMLGVRLDKNKCTDCGLCVSHCKMDIRRVGDHECINCGECIAICPAKAISWKGSGLFVHKNAVEEIPAPVESKPLAAVLSGGSAQESVSELPEGQESAEIAATADGQSAVKTKKRDRKFLLQAIAWTAALCVLVGALVYYNVIDAEPPASDDPVISDDPSQPVVGNQVGNLCPDFTVSRYGEEGEFSLSASAGKITVINFWATWCTPCVAEIPYFEQLYAEYSESVTVVAIHGTFVTEDVVSFIQTKGWSDYGMTFAQDVEENGKSVFTTLGGKSTWPMTVILDSEGVIVYNQSGSMTYEKLLNVVTPLL